MRTAGTNPSCTARKNRADGGVSVVLNLTFLVSTFDDSDSIAVIRIDLRQVLGDGEDA